MWQLDKDQVVRGIDGLATLPLVWLCVGEVHLHWAMWQLDKDQVVGGIDGLATPGERPGAASWKSWPGR